MYEQVETPDELAARLKVAKSWLYARTRERGKGAIPRLMVGKYLRFVPSEVDQWLKDRNQAE